jgi:hypothetical protein
VSRRSWKWFVRLFAAALGLLLIGEPILAQSPPTARTIESPRRFDGVPPEIARILEAELAQNKKAEKIGVYRHRVFPMPFCTAGKCGAINRDGTFAVTPAYLSVDYFSEGVAAVKVPHRYSYLYGYVADDGRVIWKPQFPTMARSYRGFIQIDIDGRSGLIDHDGKIVLWPQFGFVVPFTSDLFWVTEERVTAEGNNGAQKFLFDAPRASLNGVIDTDVMPKGDWGLVDRKGVWMRRPEFLAIRAFDSENPGTMWAKTKAGWGLLRSDLSWQLEPQFDDVGPVREGLAIIVVDHRWGFVDANGRTVIKPGFDRVFEFVGPYAPAKTGNLWGLIDRTGVWVMEPQYDLLLSAEFLMPRTWWQTKRADKFGLLDSSLRLVMPPRMDQSAAMCTDGRIIGIIDRKWKYFSREGDQLEDDAQGCDSMISSRKKP